MGRAQGIRELDPEEMAVSLEESRKELFNLRFQLATGRLDNISRIGQVRKEIARIMTLSTERELGIDRTAVAGREAARSARGRARSGERRPARSEVSVTDEAEEAQ